MGSPLTSVPWDDCLLEPRRDLALERLSRRRLGVVAPAIPYLASRPWVARSVVTLHAEFGLLTHLDLDLHDLVSMAVSQTNSCRFCYAVTRGLLRVRGWSERRVQEMERRLTTEELDAKTLAAVRYARALSRAAPLPGADERARLLAAGFSPEEHRDLSFVAAFTEHANRLHTLPAIPPHVAERAGSGWRVTLARPVAVPMLWRLRRHGEPAESPPASAGPFSCLIHAYAGTPVAPALEETITAMTASAVLPARAKALVFAVVAHGLGCEISAREARALLPAGAADDDLDRALEHLGGPDLSPREVAVAKFARETIWYTPQDVQRRARDLLKILSTEQFVEVVGIASLANGLCRLSAAVLSA